MCSRCFSPKSMGASSIGASCVKDVLPQYHHDLDYLISMLDWDANVNPEFAKSNKRHPVPVRPVKETEEAGYRELWITYGNAYYSAKELDGAAGPQRHHQRRGSLRIDSDPGSRHFRRDAGFHAFYDPVRSTHRR